MADAIDDLAVGFPYWVNEYLRGNEPPLANIPADVKNFLNQVRDNPSAWSRELFTNTMSQLNVSTTTSTVPRATTTTQPPTTTTAGPPVTTPSGFFPQTTTSTTVAPRPSSGATTTTTQPSSSMWTDESKLRALGSLLKDGQYAAYLITGQNPERFNDDARRFLDALRADPSSVPSMDEIGGVDAQNYIKRDFFGTFSQEEALWIRMAWDAIRLGNPAPALPPSVGNNIPAGFSWPTQWGPSPASAAASSPVTPASGQMGPTTTTPTTTVPATTTTTAGAQASTPSSQPGTPTTTVPSTSTGAYGPGATAQVFTPDQVRAMFQDATSQYYGNYSQVLAYLAEQEGGTPGSTGVYGDFEAYENLPDYAWKSNGYTFTEFNQLPFQLPSEMIYALNQSFVAAGMYQQGYKPSDMRNGADPVFLETFRRLSAESFVRKQAPGEVLTGYVDRHVATVEARLEQFDQTNLAVQMDNIARNVIGRALTADEFAAVRDQMAMFATPVEEQVMAPGSTLAQDIADIEAGNVPPEISARLQANLERTFQGEALQQRTYVAASRFGQDFSSYLSGRGVPSSIAPVPEFVTQTVEAES